MQDFSQQLGQYVSPSQDVYDITPQKEEGSQQNDKWALLANEDGTGVVYESKRRGKIQKSIARLFRRSNIDFSLVKSYRLPTPNKYVYIGEVIKELSTDHFFQGIPTQVGELRVVRRIVVHRNAPSDSSTQQNKLIQPMSV